MFELLSQSNGDVVDPGLTGGHILLIVIALLQVVVFIAALVTIIGSKRYTSGGKFLWVVVVFFAPLLGAIGWFVAGRNAQIRTDVP